MTDHEDTWMKNHYMTREDVEAEVEAETHAVMKVIAKEMEKVRDQLYHLNKTHTVALMAAEMYVHLPNFDTGTAASTADTLYCEVEKALETTSISA